MLRTVIILAKENKNKKMHFFLKSFTIKHDYYLGDNID